MKQIILSLLAFALAAGCKAPAITSSTPASHHLLPVALLGLFKDDYGSRYTINDSMIIQRPGNTYHLVLADTVSKFIIARNDASNPTEPGLYTRIDYMFFEGMAPWTWGYCLTVYNAKSDAEAIAATAADRTNPRKGCNGFPFTRMCISTPTR